MVNTRNITRQRMWERAMAAADAARGTFTPLPAQRDLIPEPDGDSPIMSSERAMVVPLPSATNVHWGLTAKGVVIPEAPTVGPGVAESPALQMTRKSQPKGKLTSKGSQPKHPHHLVHGEDSEVADAIALLASIAATATGAIGTSGHISLQQSGPTTTTGSGARGVSPPTTTGSGVRGVGSSLATTTRSRVRGAASLSTATSATGSRTRGVRSSLATVTGSGAQGSGSIPVGADSVSATSDDDLQNMNNQHGDDQVAALGDGREICWIAGNKIEPGKACRFITKSLMANIPCAAHSFKDFPQHMRDKLWNMFKSTFSFLHENDVSRGRLVWESTAREHYRKTLGEARKRAKGNSGSNDPKKWKKHNPHWIRREYWEQLCDHWTSEKWQDKSKKASASRNAHPEKNLHTCGSLSYAAHREKMAQELQRPPEYRELFERTHKRKKSDQYVSENAREIVETYDRQIVEKYGDGTPRPELDTQIWLAATGEPKKGRVYGFGCSLDTSAILSCVGSSPQVNTVFGSLPTNNQLRDWITQEVDKRLNQRVTDQMIDIKSEIKQTISESISETLINFFETTRQGRPCIPPQNLQVDPPTHECDDANVAEDLVKD